jgi:membrane fusion protein (multidrug efflux system)
MSNLSKRNKIIAAVATVLVLIIGYFGYQTIMYVSTDNASIQGDTLLIASKVSGVVETVPVEENQLVKKGDVLVKIDPRDINTVLAQAQAELGSVEVSLSDAKTNHGRLQTLYKKGAVSQQQYDTASTRFNEASKKLKAAQAQVDQAQLNLSYTEIRAPADGIIARKSVEPGQVIPMGQPLLGFVASQKRWVIANFKETELHSIHLGSAASIKVDALPGRVFAGEVESISPSTGSTFTLLPPDNSTGNFTKVVQRIPVRIKLNGLSEKDLLALQVGLSAVVDVSKH